MKFFSQNFGLLINDGVAADAISVVADAATVTVAVVVVDR